MKRGIFGVILLLLLFFGGLLESRSVHRDLAPIAYGMEQASHAVRMGDTKKAAALTGKARAAWEVFETKYSSLTQQQDVWEIDSLWDEVQVFLESGETVHCSAACAELKNHLRAMLQNQQLSIHSLL